jgi:hypothetical protein
MNTVLPYTSGCAYISAEEGSWLLHSSWNAPDTTSATRILAAGCQLLRRVLLLQVSTSVGNARDERTGNNKKIYIYMYIYRCVDDAGKGDESGIMRR